MTDAPCALCPTCGLCTTPHPYDNPAVPPLVECHCEDRPGPLDRTECCGVPFDQSCKPWCVNAQEMCRDCGDAHPDPADCPRDRHARLDAWQEALLGARLRFHCTSLEAVHRMDYWAATYRRWQELYRDNGGTM